MIKQWYTARELAEFNLKGMPKTRRGILSKAKNEYWTFRERKASGGGKEYHVSNLPESAQISLIESAVGQDRLSDLECRAASLQMVKERGRAKFTNEERVTARIAIVSLYNKFRASMNMGVLAAEQPFLKLYAAEQQKNESAFIPAWIFEIYPEFSAQSLRNWRSSKKNAKTLKDLQSKYGNRKGTGVLDRANNGEIASYIAALITKQSHLTAGHIRDLCINQFGHTVQVINAKTNKEEDKSLPKIRAFERFIQSWKENNRGLFLNLTDPDSYKNKMQPAFGKADANVHDLNQVWEIDASPVDAMCNDGRWNMYSIIDVYSRKAIFSVSRTAATEASLLIIRRAILEWGVPTTIKTDNGADFKSYRFQNALVALGIEQHICPAFTPEGKSFVERVFGTLQRDLMPLLPGFIGHNVADRSKIEQTKAFSQRLGESKKDAFKIDMDAEELQAYINEWATHKYGDRIHSSIKQSPNERAQKWVGSIKKIENERVLDILLAPIATGKGYRRVTKSGIRTENTVFIAPELALHMGESVFIRHNPDDLGRIYVFKDEKGEFICEATNAESLGISRKHAATEAKVAQKEILKEKRKEIKAIQRGIKPRDMVQAILKRNAQDADNVVSFRPETIHTSAGIEEAHKALKTFNPKEKTELSDTQKDRQKKIVDDIAALDKPQIIQLDSKQQRLQRAAALEDRLAKGNRVSSQDESWLTKYQKLPEYLAKKKMEEFGNSWFEEKGENQ